MKKVLSILLTMVMLASLVTLSIAAEPDASTLAASTIPAPDLAYTSIGNAIATDAAAGTTTTLAETNWSFRFGDSIANLAEPTIEKTGPFGTYGYYTSPNENKFPTVTPTGYTFGTVTVPYHIQNVATFEKANYPDIQANPGNTTDLPERGLIFSVSQLTTQSADNFFAVTYTAPKTGTVTLNDPDGGKIASLWRIGMDADGKECKPNCLYGTGNARNVKLSIYKNNEKIWPEGDDYLFYHNQGGDRKFSVEFPTLEDIDVRTGDEISIVFDGSTNTTNCSMAFALNPQITYANPVDLAYTTIGNAIATDAAAGTTTALAETNWSFQSGESKDSLVDRTIAGTGDFGIFDKKYPATTPTAYNFDSVSVSWVLQNVAAYNSTSFNGIEAVNSTDVIPSSGIIFSVSQRTDKTTDDYFAMTYTAPKEGYVTLSDPDNGMLTAIYDLGKDANGSNCRPNTVYYSGGGNKRNVKFGIYKNGERIWPADDDFLFYHNAGTDRKFSVDFPTLENISVNAGDKLQLIFDGSFNTDNATTMTFALNPQVEYVYQDIGDVNEDWDVDICDLVAMKNYIDKTEPEYNVIFDLIRNDAVDTFDLAALRQYLLGAITEF